MKITDLKILYLAIPTDEFGLPNRTQELFLAKVFTDEGIIGAGGQNGMTFNKMGHKLWGKSWGKFMEELVKKYLVNEIVEPYNIGKFVRYFRTHPMTTYISPRPNCVEMALWDIVGKKAGLPVHRLLGACQEKVKAYASLFAGAFDTKAVEKALETGFKAVKASCHNPNIQTNIENIKGLRDQVGNDIDIMVDAEQAWQPYPHFNLRQAIKLARGFEKYDVAWLEEPLPHLNNPDLSAQLCDAVDIPIAGGAQIYGIHLYKHVLEKGALDIVQPDVMFCGGILEFKNIANLAERFGRLCYPHFWGPGIGLAATLQVLGATDIPWVEYPYALHPEARDCMLRKPLKIDKEGYIEIPKEPGLSFELNDEVIEKYTI